MALPLEIRFRNLEPSSAVESEVRDAVQNLDGRVPPTARCCVVVEAEPARGRAAPVHHVDVTFTAPDGMPLGTGAPVHAHHADAEILVAVRQAFAVLTREVGVEGPPPVPERQSQGRILRLRLEDGFGAIESVDGREVYFHRNALAVGSFDALRVGTPVSYIEIRSDLGPRATRVEVLVADPR